MPVSVVLHSLVHDFNVIPKKGQFWTTKIKDDGMCIIVFVWSAFPVVCDDFKNVWEVECLGNCDIV